MRSKVFKSNIAFGILVGFVLVFGVQGIADAADLPLTKGSGDFQEKTPGNTFEITFTINQRSNTTSIRDNKKLVTDGQAITTPIVAAGTQARINSSGYLVEDIGSTAYRHADSPVTNGMYRVSSSQPWTPASTGTDLFIGNTNTNLYYRVGAKAYRVYAQDPGDSSLGDTSAPLTAEPLSQVPRANRYHYNEEKVDFEVDKDWTTFENDATLMTFRLKANNFQRNLTELEETPGSSLETLPRSVTLICDPQGDEEEGVYTVRIYDATPVTDTPLESFPGDERAYIEFTLRVVEDTYDASEHGIAADFSRTETSKPIRQIDGDFTVTGTNLEIRYKVEEGRGTLYAAVSEEATPYKGPHQDLTVHQAAKVFLNTNSSDNEIEASIADSPVTEPTATIRYDYTGSDRRDDGDDGDDPPPPAPPANTITISPSSLSGTPGETETITISNPAGVQVNLSGSGFTFSPTSGTATSFTSTVTLPSASGSHTITATGVIGGNTITDTTSVTVTSPGTLTARQDGGQIYVTASPPPSSTLTFTLTRSGINVGSGQILTAGSGRAIPIGLTTGSHILIVDAEGYNATQVTFTPGSTPATGQQQPTGGSQQPQQQAVGGTAESIEIDGARTLEGTVGTSTRLRVRVLDANDRGVSDVRVTFRILAPGRGRLSLRGNGRAVQANTDRNGYANAALTPLGGNLIVEARAAGVTAAVSFIIDVDEDTTSPPTTETPTTATSSREINPVVQVTAANRPPMLWIDSGEIYALVGTTVKKFTSGVQNAQNLAIGGNKVYWTEQTGDESGTINSANLDGSNAKELAAIKAVPYGIAVDTDASKLYWTNSRHRIQSANLDGSRIRNVLENLDTQGFPTDLTVDRGIVYWTMIPTHAESPKIGIVNPTARGVPKYISTGSKNIPKNLVVSGGKVYWTEETGEWRPFTESEDAFISDGRGTINSANLNGAGAKELKEIRAVPSGIAVDAARSKLYWTNSRGRIQSADLDGSGVQTVVDGLASPGDMVLSNSIKAPTETSTTTTAGKSKYDINGDGSVDSTDVDALLLVVLAELTDAKYDVNGDGAVDAKDIRAVNANLDAGAAGAPTLLGKQFSALEVSRLQEQIELLIATDDRSPAAIKTLIYLQQLIALARPEKTQLLTNYPNPFNPETWIPYELATDTDVKITIYSSTGVVVRTLQFGYQSAGYYTDRERAAYWDGKNAQGEQVASGVYFYQLETDDMSSLRKMVILK